MTRSPRAAIVDRDVSDVAAVTGARGSQYFSQRAHAVRSLRTTKRIDNARWNP
jgi:hypothetical protein